MKIVVLAGGTSTERDVSIVSGTGICGALRQKGHQAILVDVFCGQEEVDWEDPFPAEYDVEKGIARKQGNLICPSQLGILGYSISGSTPWCGPWQRTGS